MCSARLRPLVVGSLPRLAADSGRFAAVRPPTASAPNRNSTRTSLAILAPFASTFAHSPSLAHCSPCYGSCARPSHVTMRVDGALHISYLLSPICYLLSVICICICSQASAKDRDFQGKGGSRCNSQGQTDYMRSCRLKTGPSTHTRRGPDGVSIVHPMHAPKPHPIRASRLNSPSATREATARSIGIGPQA